MICRLRGGVIVRVRVFVFVGVVVVAGWLVGCRCPWTKECWKTS